ncbi:ABZJ_00895 family protein [Pokkaliibacter sp. CJK22405]|uniref:ABZJ_00895 family protein n=1 Tax=Pokkaliibacter sp. CJK22405 TaxID=3384615 RepID=UPI0039846FBF
MSDRVPLTPYLMKFATAYVIASMVVWVIVNLLHVGTSLTALALLLASYFAVYRFVKDQQRAPNRSEKWRLVFSSLAAVWVFTLAGVFAIFLTEGQAGGLHQKLAGQPLGGVLITFLIISLVAVFLLHLSYGWFASSLSKVLNKED